MQIDKSAQCSVPLVLASTAVGAGSVSVAKPSKRRPTLSRSRLMAALVALVLPMSALVVVTGASPAGAGTVFAASDMPEPLTVVETFNYTGAAQTSTVPANATSATFDVYGAGGGAFNNETPSRGGRATATISVTPGASIEVYVGGQGRDTFFAPGTGGFNGGSTVGRMSGGGASDVRIGGTTLSHRAVVAGGGGGGVTNCGSSGPSGGAGGGLTGGSGVYTAVCNSLFGAQPGTGGTQSAGGTNPGSAAAAGTLGSGGPSAGRGGGGGGGGYYGGAGGFNTGAGGGGSGFGPAGTQFETGTRSGDGLVTITYATAPDTTAPTLSIGHTPNGTNGWNTTSPTTVDVAASDSGSGLAGTPTCTDGATDLPLTPSGDGTWTAAVSGEGTHAVSCSVSDIMGNTTGATDTVKIDTIGPVMSCTASPSALRTSANNHKLVAVTTSVSVTDAGSGTDQVAANRFELLSAASNQADSGLATDDVAGDVQGWTTGTPDTSGQVRTERYGADRIYTLTYQGRDQAGNTSTCQATVTVRKR